MSKTISFKEASKTDWVVEVADEIKYPGDKNIQLGCLMRIASATEAMAKSHTDLILEKERLKTTKEYYRTEYEAAKRREAALKGHITRLKNKLKTQ